MSNPIYAVILAGGSGERFWPLSRAHRPKQLLKLLSEKTLIEETITRLEGLVPESHILIITNQQHAKEIRLLLPNFPEENIIAEPAKRDTAPAIALGVGLISRRDPSATMIVLPADHVIQDQAAFQRDILAAATAAKESGALVTIGIRPTWACPGYGYIEAGGLVSFAGLDSSTKVNQVVRFREKPNTELAESFLKDGNFRWNAGMFVWTIPSIVCEMHRHTPALARFVDLVRTAPNLEACFAEHFPTLPKNSIDYAILEKAERVLMVESTFDWDDVGSWTALAAYLKCDANGNTANQPLTTHDSNNNIVFSDSKTHVALLGVSDLIVVQTGDAILVCHRQDAEKIKRIVSELPAELK